MFHEIIIIEIKLKTILIHQRQEINNHNITDEKNHRNQSHGTNTDVDSYKDQLILVCILWFMKQWIHFDFMRKYKSISIWMSFNWNFSSSQIVIVFDWQAKCLQSNDSLLERMLETIYRILTKVPIWQMIWCDMALVPISWNVIQSIVSEFVSILDGLN